MELNIYKATDSSWGVVAKLFHWIIAILIFFQVAAGINLHFMEFSMQKPLFIDIHKISGSFLLILVFLRIIWRFYNSKPSNKEVPLMHIVVSKTVHVILYALMIFIPIQGMVLTWTGGYDVSLLGLYNLPRLVEENLIKYEQFKSLHYYFALLLTFIFTIHLSAGLYHRFITKDKYGIWKRMSFKK
jgi:cytochrome b561